MSDNQSNLLPELPTVPFDSGSGWATSIRWLGLLVLLLCSFSVLGVIGGAISVNIFLQLFVAGTQLLIISHVIQILAEIRWFTYKTSKRLSSESFDSSDFSSVVHELKKISEQNKEQSEALKKSIEELSEKAEKTNTYLYHIYKK